jgi:hypothetical protein
VCWIGHSLCLFQYDHDHDGIIPLVDLSPVHQLNDPTLEAAERRALYTAYERKPDTAIDFGAFTRIVSRSGIYDVRSGVPCGTGLCPWDTVGIYELWGWAHALP